MEHLNRLTGGFPSPHLYSLYSPIQSTWHYIILFFFKLKIIILLSLNGEELVAFHEIHIDTY